MIKRTFTKVLDINKIYNTAESFTIARGDTVQFSFTFTNGETEFPLNDMTKARLYAKRIKSNGVDASSTPLFSKEITYPSTVTSVDATFTSSETAGAAGQYLFTVILFDADDNTITTSNIPFELFENGYSGIYQPAENFRDECMDAKDAAEAAATKAEQLAGLAYEYAQSAQAATDSASVSEFNAQSSAKAAETHKESCSYIESDCSGYAYSASTSASQAERYMNDCGTMTSFAQEVARIAIVSITGTSQTIQPNKCYTLNADGGSYTLTPETQTTTPEYLLQAMVQITTGDTAPTITWANVEHFFNDKIPTINANSSYNIIYEFDNNLLTWVVGVVKK